MAGDIMCTIMAYAVHGVIMRSNWWIGVLFNLLPRRRQKKAPRTEREISAGASFAALLRCLAGGTTY